ncbi:MAG TPA: rhomboid family intramembrane serine protease [Planctomycetota bacterium]|nr:rhomboid family intramembrane serine protease [Planctomycetota bacterium]
MLPISDTVQRRNLPWMTWALVAVNGWAFWQLATMSNRQIDAALGLFALVPAAPRPEAWLTHMFLHGGLAHLVGNLWTLWLFGDNVEDRLGPLRYLGFYLLCGLAAAGVHVYTNSGSTVPVIGASGAIAGVMGAYLVMFPRARLVVMLPPFVWWLFELPAVIYLVLWFWLQVVQGTAALGDEVTGGVAWWAHVGGFVAGIVLLPLFVRRDRWSRADPGYRPARRAGRA